MKVLASLVNSTSMPESTNKKRLVNPLALQASITHALVVGNREVLWDRHTLRVQVAVNASAHIIFLTIELVALKLDLATHGINARRCSERHRNHPVHHGSPEERSVVALHGQRVAQQEVARVHEETLDATELVELVCFPEHIF